MHDAPMNMRDGDFQGQKPVKRLQFGRYVLNLDRGCLLLDGNEITLRPKTFAVLHYLMENAGRLVSKDELFDAVWPNLSVTDDALVQSVGELRRALGDEGQRLIKTVPRRGYRFEAEVSVAAPIEQISTETTSASVASRDVPPGNELAVPLPAFLSAIVPAGRRIRLFASIALVALLAAVSLRSGDLIYLKLPERVIHPDRTAARSPDIGARPAIAILPFQNRSDDSSREYFADGLTQDVISALGRFSELTVMSWNAVFPYKGKPASPGEIARSLAVRYQVEGTVRHSGDRIRVTAQIVDADGRVRWSGNFDEALVDIFALQDKITTQIAGALAIRVSQVEQRRAFAKPTESLEAYDYALRARPALQRPTRANNAEARVLLRRATELDPNYAAAYGALAETFHVATAMGWAESPNAFLGRAEDLANRALSLDDSEVRARIILARIHIFYQRYEQARTEIDRAIAVNPNDAHGLAGRGNILTWLGQTDAAIEALELAQRIDPELNAIDRFALSLAYYLKRRYDAAIEQAERNLHMTASANFSRILLAAAYAQQNRVEDVDRIVTIIRRVNPTFDPQAFGSKFLNPADLEHLRDGFRKAGL
jgi:TolB-like protein/DNA-binding winged helix-turn-helix (wHTH) protein/Tfp pilus assembly protein PilF